MSSFPFEFGDPVWLALLGVLPLVWLLSFRSLAALGPVRRIVAILVRSCVVALLIFAIADLEWKQNGDRVAVIFLFDRSLSVPERLQAAATDYANREIAKHRAKGREDLAGAIIFGGGAAVDHPPTDADVQLSYNNEVRVDSEHTNIAAGLRLAQAAFPENSARRVVVITDGNGNLGNTMDEARRLADAGIGIDVVPIRYPRRDQVLAEKITLPSEIRRSQPFDLRVVLNNTAPPVPGQRPRTGRLKVTRKTADDERTLAESSVSLEPGKRVFTLREQVDAPDFYTYQAVFIPDDIAHDPVTQNKRVTTFADVRGQGEVLILANSDDRRGADFLADRLRRENLRVTVQPSRETFATLADLQPYDTVVLDDVPRDDFSDEQLKMLASNTEQLGGGLVMLGGPNSFGSGGWTNTPIEDAMPVEFQIKNAKVMPIGALALLIDRSGSMTGEKLAMAKAAAMAAARVLSANDYLTVATFDFEAHLIVPITKKGESTTIESRIDKIGADGGTNMRPGLLMVHDQLGHAHEAAARHILVLTDGLTEGTKYPELVQQFRNEGITISTVGVGPDADVRLLDQLARIGGGNFYAVKSPKILPRIFQDEARIVARPLVYEHKPGWAPEVAFPHEMIRGLGDAIPPLTGYVRTRLKDNPLVEESLASPLPQADPKYNVILASWNYGLGKAVAFTTDAGQRWTGTWRSWLGYEKLFGQIVRWSMRPSGDRGKFSLTTDLVDQHVRFVVTAIDKDNDFLNFLNMSARVVGPNMQAIDTSIQQVAPGRYVGEFDASQSGSYMLMVSPGAGAAPIVGGVNVPYSAEYLDREPNEELLHALASLTPRGGKPGVEIEAPTPLPEERAELLSDNGAIKAAIDKWLTVNTFRTDLAISTHVLPAWHLAALAAAIMLLIDVFVRRVRADFTWLHRWIAASVALFYRRPAQSVAIPTMERLRNRKIEIAQSIERQRATTRFQSATDDPPLQTRARSELDSLAELHGPDRPDRDQIAEQADEESYTGRLLRAKRNATDPVRRVARQDRGDGSPTQDPKSDCQMSKERPRLNRLGLQTVRH